MTSLSPLWSEWIPWTRGCGGLLYPITYVLMTLAKKLFWFLTVVILSLSSFVSADMTKQKACKLKDWSYPKTNLTTVWKPYVDYNKSVWNSYQKKTANVNWFYKGNWFLYYIVNFQTQDMTYTARANLFSYNCKKAAIKQISPMSFAKWAYAESNVIYADWSEFLLANQTEEVANAYSLFSKVTKKNTKIDITTFKNFNLIGSVFSYGTNSVSCTNASPLVVKNNWKWYVACASTYAWSWNDVKLEIDLKNKEFLFSSGTM